VTDSEIAAMFRAAVTCGVAGDPISATLGRSPEMTKTDVVMYAGLGVAMTVNMVKIIAELWDTPPTIAWETIVQIGREQGLPGMEIG
jgi:hypothetical protein